MQIEFFVEVTPDRGWNGRYIQGPKRVRFFRNRPKAERRLQDSHLTKVTLEVPNEYFEAQGKPVEVVVDPPRAIRAVS